MFVLFAPYVCFFRVFLSFFKYKYLIVNLVFPTSVWSGDFFLIAPFPIHCLLVHVPFYFSLYDKRHK